MNYKLEEKELDRVFEEEVAREMEDDLYAPTLGRYGQLRLGYLHQFHPILLEQMKMLGTLEKHLVQVERDAEEMVGIIISQLVRQEGVDARMKRRDPVGWAGCMNNIRSRAEEAVLPDILYPETG